MKTFIYSRKSTDDSHHQVLSIERQEQGNMLVVEKHQLAVITHYEEKRSAKLPGRPAFGQMLERIERGEANVLVCWRLDRLARNLIDGGRIITLLQMGILQRIYTHDRIFTPADSTLILAVEFGMATQYVRDLSQAVKAGMEQKVKRGIWPVIPPVGYRNNRLQKTIELDPKNATNVREAFNLFASGQYSLEQICQNLGPRGLLNHNGRPLQRGSLWRTLQNPFYYGLMLYKGRLFPGTHTPLISKELFDRVQSRLNQRTHAQRYGRKPFIFRGNFRCGECGCLITLEVQKGISYMRCTKKRGKCSQKYTHLEAVADQISAVISHLAIPKSIALQLEAVITERKMQTEETRAAKDATLREQRESIEHEQMELLSLLTRGIVSETHYVKRSNELTNALHQLQEQIRQATAGNRLEPEDDFLFRLNEAAVLETVSKLKEKRDFLKQIGSNWQLRDSTVSLDLERRWKIWLEWKNRHAKNFSKMPVGYQRALLWSLLDAVRTVEPNPCCSISEERQGARTDQSSIHP